MKTILLIFCPVFMLLSCTRKTSSDHKAVKVMLAVLAHPDDESAIGQVLSRYAGEGHKVYLVVAADGRYGVEEHAGIPPGDSLAEIRKNETICACEILGIEKPVFLGAHDGFGIVSGLDEYFIQTAEIRKKLTNQIMQINPDAIITFGPDGDTGHPDHRGISDIVTEVILMNEGWYEKYPLYYLAWPREKEVDIPQGKMSSLNYVDERYRNVHIAYSNEDREKVFKSLYCYKSQFTNDDVAKWIAAEKKDTTFTTYFRQFVTNTKVKTDFR